MNRLGERLLFWAPRVLCMLFAAFISLFALDVFGGARGFWTTLAALGMHLIPTAAVVAVTIIAWRHPWVGAIAFFATGLFYSLTVGAKNPIWILGIAGPQFLIAVLFFFSWIRRRKAGGIA